VPATRCFLALLGAIVVGLPLGSALITAIGRRVPPGALSTRPFAHGLRASAEKAAEAAPTSDGGKSASLSKSQGSFLSRWWRVIAGGATVAVGFLMPFAVVIAVGMAAGLGFASSRLLRRQGKKKMFSFLGKVSDEETADFFSKLPQALEGVNAAIEVDKKTKPWDVVSASVALFDYTNTRPPYSEVREAYAEALKVPEGDLPQVPTSWYTLSEELWPFAEAAYNGAEAVEEACTKLGFYVIFLDAKERPGNPMHFLCYHPEKKVAVLAIRGTQTAADIVTDVVHSVEEVPGTGGETAFWAHSGMLAAARNVVERATPVLRDFCIPQGYRLLLTGHSLGAGTAALATRLFMEAADMGTEDTVKGTCVKWPQPISVQCVCFAPPPILDPTCAVSLGEAMPDGDGTPRILSIVYNADMVPRAGMHNLRLLARIFEEVQEAIASKKGEEKRRATQTAFFKGLDLGSAGEGLMDSMGLGKKDLYVPGKVVVLHPIPNVPGKKQAQKPEDVPSPVRAIQGDGKLPELRYLELAPPMITDHLPEAYAAALEEWRKSLEEAGEVTKKPTEKAEEPKKEASGEAGKGKEEEEPSE